jgi:DNA adenine methylase
MRVMYLWLNINVAKVLRCKSPLRYPGGKSKALEQILPYVPTSFSEYREPFIGGGSLFIYLKQRHPQLSFWINDLNVDLYSFWISAQKDIEALAKAVSKIKQECLEGKELFRDLVNQKSGVPLNAV